jgi:Uracil DNA glycosylase superfamily/Domain of unknown function (DUF4130
MRQRLPAEADHRSAVAAHCLDRAFHTAHHGRHDLLRFWRLVGGGAQQLDAADEALAVFLQERGAIDEQKVLRNVAFTAGQPLALHADHLDGQTARHRHRVAEQIAGVGGKTHHHVVARRLREQALRQFSRQARGHVQLAEQHAVVLGMHGAQRPATVGERLLLNAAHRLGELGACGLLVFFSCMRWALLTPRGCAHWSGTALTFGPPAKRERAPAADAGEALWLAYYRSIFNPARLKLAMMKREMPVRFWNNLPEAASIGPLAAAAGERTERMVQDGAAPRTRRRATACSTQARGSTDLAAQAKQCDRCEFAAQATQMVWGEGERGAALMLVGEQPGDREDLEGRPFVGPAGQLLRNEITTLGWPEAQLYLTNAVKHFKFEWRGNRRLHKTAAQREALAVPTGSKPRSNRSPRAPSLRWAPPPRARCSGSRSPSPNTRASGCIATTAGRAAACRAVSASRAACGVAAFVA